MTDLEKFKKLEEIFPDGFLVMHANPDGKLQYFKWNPRRIQTFEEWEMWIVESIKSVGSEFLKGFIPSSEIPDYFPKDWEGGEQ